MTFEALTRSTPAIGMCMGDFIPKRGAGAVQEGGDDAEV